MFWLTPLWSEDWSLNFLTLYSVKCIFVANFKNTDGSNGTDTPEVTSAPSAPQGALISNQILRIQSPTDPLKSSSTVGKNNNQTAGAHYLLQHHFIYSKILAFRICKLQNSRFLHSVCRVGNQEAVAQLLTASKPIIQPAGEKPRQWITKWSKRAAPCMDFRLWTPTTLCCYKVTWKRFSSMLLDLYAALPLLPPPSHHSFLF